GTPAVKLDPSGNTVKLDSTANTVTLDGADSTRLGEIDAATNKLRFDAGGNLQVVAVPHQANWENTYGEEIDAGSSSVLELNPNNGIAVTFISVLSLHDHVAWHTYAPNGMGNGLDLGETDSSSKQLQFPEPMPMTQVRMLCLNLTTPCFVDVTIAGD